MASKHLKHKSTAAFSKKISTQTSRGKHHHHSLRHQRQKHKSDANNEKLNLSDTSALLDELTASYRSKHDSKADLREELARRRKAAQRRAEEMDSKRSGLQERIAKLMANADAISAELTADDDNVEHDIDDVYAFADKLNASATIARSKAVTNSIVPPKNQPSIVHDLLSTSIVPPSQSNTVHELLSGVVRPHKVCSPHLCHNGNTFEPSICV